MIPAGPVPSEKRKALVFAVGVVVSMLLFAFSLSRSPLPEPQKEVAVRWVLSPLLMITGAIVWLVDLAGPGGRAEPASMYLPAWANWLIVALAGVVLLSLLFASGMSFQSWRRRQGASK